MPSGPDPISVPTSSPVKTDIPSTAIPATAVATPTVASSPYPSVPPDPPLPTATPVVNVLPSPTHVPTVTPTEIPMPAPTATILVVPTNTTVPTIPPTSTQLPTPLPESTVPLPTPTSVPTTTPTPMPQPVYMTNSERVQCLIDGIQAAREKVMQERMSGGEQPVISSKPRPKEGTDECDVFSDPNQEPPRFVTANHVDILVIQQVSRFRSHAGHDYSDSYEDCSSMKHYFYFNGGQSKTEYLIYSPVSGTVISVMPDGIGPNSNAGYVVWISPEGHPQYYVKLFHVEPVAGLEAGSKVVAGEVIGNAIGINETNDVAVHQYTVEGERYVSVFEAMSDEAFAPWQTRGMMTRAGTRITTEFRNENPLACEGDFFVERTADFGDSVVWIMLEPA